MAAVLDEVAQRCASTAMVYLMHLCGVACYATAPDKTGAHFASRRRAAPVHAGLQRKRIAQPLLGAGEPRGEETRRRRRSPEREQVVRHLRRPGRRLRRLDARGRRDDTAREHHLPRAPRRRGVSVGGAWRGLGMRGNASAPMTLRTSRSAPTAR